MVPQAWNIGTVGWFGILPILLASLALIGIVVVVIFVLRQATSRRRGGENGTIPAGTQDQTLSPREILQIRYVCGEINRDQYYQMMTDLN
jgi:uncharacterized membrane protein